MGARILIASLACFACLTPAARAQDAGAAATLGVELISSAEADGVFELLPSEQLVLLRHAGSGMICTFDPNFGSRLFVAPGEPRGDTVSCDTEDAAGHFTLSATRQDEAQPIEAAMTETMEGIESWARDLQPLSATANSVAPDQSTLPENRSLSFTFEGPEGATYGRAGVAITNGWIISMVYFAPVTDETAQALATNRSHMLWTSALAQIEVTR